MTTNELVKSVEVAAKQLTTNPLCNAFFKKCITRKVKAIKANPTNSGCLQVLEDLKLMAENMLN